MMHEADLEALVLPQFVQTYAGGVRGGTGRAAG